MPDALASPASVDASTIASLATAAGTLVLAIATFSATRSANRAARVSELALQTQLRPVLFPARYDDPPLKIGWGDAHRARLKGGLAYVGQDDGTLYFGMLLRNVGSGLGVIHSWNGSPRRAPTEEPNIEHFRPHLRDMYVPAGDIGFWQAALRDPEDELRAALAEVIAEGGMISLEILYGDHLGGQRTVTRFVLEPRPDPGDEPCQWLCAPVRHWNVDGPQPRGHG